VEGEIENTEREKRPLLQRTKQTEKRGDSQEKKERKDENHYSIRDTEKRNRPSVRRGNGNRYLIVRNPKKPMSKESNQKLPK